MGPESSIREPGSRGRTPRDYGDLNVTAEERSPSPDPLLQAFLSQAQTKDTHTSQEAEKLFSAGVGRKSRFQKEKEEAERKRKEAEQEAAEVYKDFVESFENPASRQNRSKDKFLAAGGRAYEPTRAIPPPSDDPGLTSNTEKYKLSFKRASASAFGDEEDPDREAESLPPPAPSKRAKLNSITEGLRKAQEAREASLRPRLEAGESVSAILGLGRKKRATSAGVEAAKDKSTTNVCVTSLPGGVDEESLGNHFSQFGDVGTVKIMWPRVDPSAAAPPNAAVALRRERSTGCTAFIAFMRRSDAEEAVERSNDSLWRGTYITVGWGKAVSLPLSARFPQSTHSPSPEPADLPASKQQSTPLKLLRQQVAIVMGTRPDERTRVEETADKVRKYGPQYENYVRSHARDDAWFAFLFDDTVYARLGFGDRILPGKTGGYTDLYGYTLALCPSVLPHVAG